MAKADSVDAMKSVIYIRRSINCDRVKRRKCRYYLDLLSSDVVERQVGGRLPRVSHLSSISSLHSTSPRLEHAAIVCNRQTDLHVHVIHRHVD